MQTLAFACYEVMFIANSSTIYARIDSDLKSNAEKILSTLGITPSVAIQMLYSQIVLTEGIPFAVRLPARKPKSLSEMTREELNEELSRGLESLEKDPVYSADEIDKQLNRNFGI